ncbi:GNAT family N-acetyltransferase [Neobacillus niacini]|uniref:GNAT family N-acetyltransferase n=1 Tax=Neobacillus niacini TaxID=86668 RepID=UPI00285BAD39|nr:GNAT family N-acetyltransferase [Neobacillus niacini]MDR7002127.1 putative GNAT family acetyltransferase [Neobacillus niacini]
MIRRLDKRDHEACLRLLKTRPAENLFIIGDIESYGYEQEFQKLWGEFNENGELIAVLLKFEENYIPFATDSFNAQGFAEIMSIDSAFKMMSGLKEITEQIEPFLNQSYKRKRQTHYAKCTKLNVDAFNIDFSNIQQATPEDAAALVELLTSVPEFGDSTTTLERKHRELKDGSSRSFFLKVDGKMVSTASTAAENSMSAMVVGVATLENYKKKGYATKCMLRLCSQLLYEGKELCLFYDNPEAGAIYKRIGFEDIGFWMMYTYR